MTESDIHNYQLSEKIGGKWKDLSRALEYRQAEIDSIQKDQGGCTRECCIAVLVRWMGREGRNATVRILAAALIKAELKNVADELMCMDTTQVRKSTFNYGRNKKKRRNVFHHLAIELK